MSPQGFQLRPVELSDLPALKRWRSLPEVRQHLRHPDISWPQHLAWWWSIRRHVNPTTRVWAVTYCGMLVGQVGLYYKMGPAAEVSVVVVSASKAFGVQEEYSLEQWVVKHLLPPVAEAWGLTTLWAEVLTTAPLPRHSVFPQNSVIWADRYSTLYRWSIA